MDNITIDGKEYRLVPVKKKEEKKNYALFILTMPGVGSWNGKWSGEGKLFARKRRAFYRGKPTYPNLKEGKFGYHWEDGWSARIEVKFVTLSEANKMIEKSKGFCGYDWMIDSLCKHGEIINEK